MLVAATFLQNELTWRVQQEEGKKQPGYKIICAPRPFDDIVRADRWFSVQSTSASEREMIDNIFSPTEEAAAFLDRHQELEAVLAKVANGYDRFFEEKPALGLAVFNDPERVKDFLMVNICPKWDYDPMQAIREMEAFEDWARPFSLPYKDRLFFNLFYEQRADVFRMAR